MPQIIHRPGWTTPAKWELVNGLVDSITAGAKALNQMHAALVAASRQVGA